MFISNDEVSDRLCKCCGYAENPDGWEVCALCGTTKSLDINNQFSEYEVAHDIGIDNQKPNVLFIDESTEYQVKHDLGIDNQEPNVLLKDDAESIDKINQIENENLDNESLSSRKHKLLYKLYTPKKLYSGLTFTVVLLTFSAFTWFLYYELESQQISQYNTSVLADKIADKWVTDLKSKSKQLKQSISDKDGQIDEKNKQIKDLSQSIKDKDRQIEELGKSINEKNKQIKQEKQKLKELCNVTKSNRMTICKIESEFEPDI